MCINFIEYKYKGENISSMFYIYNPLPRHCLKGGSLELDFNESYSSFGLVLSVCKSSLILSICVMPYLCPVVFANRSLYALWRSWRECQGCHQGWWHISANNSPLFQGWLPSLSSFSLFLFLFTWQDLGRMMRADDTADFRKCPRACLAIKATFRLSTLIYCCCASI